MCHIHSDISVRQMAQTTWQDFNSFFGNEAETVSTRTECSILLCCPFYEKHFRLSQLPTLPCFITCPISVCLRPVWDAGSTRAQNGLRGRTGKDRRTKRRVWKRGKERLPEKWPLTNFSLVHAHFPAPGFIASLLWEQEPRRLFNIISSSQYIIPLQILVYLYTRATFMDRDEEWKGRRKRVLAAQSLCYSVVPSLFRDTWSRSARLKLRRERLCRSRSNSTDRSCKFNSYSFITENHNGV